MIVVGISSMVKRHASLIDTVNSLTPQVDRIHVYLQEGHPAKPSDFQDPGKVELIRDYGRDMGDAGKFYRASHYSDDYYLSCDDDLIYPPDYVERVVEGIDTHGGIVGFHGVLMNRNPRHYYSDRRVLHGLGDLESDLRVHVIGTCSAGFHTSEVPFNYDHCREPNIADIWISLFAQDHKIPVAALSHAAGWIKHTDKIDMSETLFEGFHRDKNYPGNKHIRRKWRLFSQRKKGVV